MKLKVAMFAITAAFACTGSAWASGTSCEGLAKLNLPNVEITTATLAAKGAYTPPAGGPGGGGPNAAAQAKLLALPKSRRAAR